MGNYIRNNYITLLILTIILFSFIPLIFVSPIPLIDLPGHMAQYKVASHLETSPYLKNFFDYHWVLVGNLGVDVPVFILSKFSNIETASHIVVMSIPPLTVAGMLFLANEIHGRIPPTAYFALPLSYAFPFQFGFVNFTLAAALMLLALGLWIRLGRMEGRYLRPFLFIPISFLLFIAHVVAWGMFGLSVIAIEWVTARERGATPIAALSTAIRVCLPLAPPILLMADWWLYRSTGDSGKIFAAMKIYSLFTILRDNNEQFDIFSALLLYTLIIFGLRKIGLVFDRRLGASAILLLVAFLLMPDRLMGAYYADMRMAAYIIGIAILALRPSSDGRTHTALLMVAGLAFFAARLGVQTHTYWKLDHDNRLDLAALEHVPFGSRVFSMTTAPCPVSWEQPRTDHLMAMATVRRDAFVNDQWPMPGGRLLTVTYKEAPGFDLDPSEIIRPAACRQPGSLTARDAMMLLPRKAFDFVWLINVPGQERPRQSWLQPIWQGPRSILYRIVQ